MYLIFGVCNTKTSPKFLLHFEYLLNLSTCEELARRLLLLLASAIAQYTFYSRALHEWNASHAS